MGPLNAVWGDMRPVGVFAALLLALLLCPAGRAAGPPVGEVPFGPFGPIGTGGVCVAYDPPDDLQYQTSGTCGTATLRASAGPEGVDLSGRCRQMPKFCNFDIMIRSGTALMIT